MHDRVLSGGRVRSPQSRGAGAMPWRPLQPGFMPSSPAEARVGTVGTHVDTPVPLTWLCFLDPKCFLLLTRIK